MFSMAAKTKPSADDQLAPENYRELNRTFYAAKPHDYFSQRLSNLILTAGRHEDLDRLMTEGATYRGLKVGSDAVADGTNPPDGEESKEEERAKSAEHFVIAEAEVLAHHVGETLLRLYLAHAYAKEDGPPACPWLEISRLRSFSKVKGLVAARFGPDSDPDDPANLAEVARAFYLTDDPAGLTTEPIPDGRWHESLRKVEGYLRGFAHQFLDRAALYNTAKHGLALMPSEMTMRLDDGALIRADGPIIQYLEIRERDDGTPRWSQVNHWVKSDRQMALVHRATVLIETLWESARLRYLPDQRPERVRLRLFGGPGWDEIMFSGAEETGGIVIEDMKMELLYYMTDEQASAEAAMEAAAAAGQATTGPAATMVQEEGTPLSGHE
jgi:hypothetical protein